MGESNDERIARKKRERAEFLAQQKADEELAKKLDNDPDFAKDFDDSFVKGFTGFEDDLLKKIADDKGMSASERRDMERAAERARKAMRGGFLSAPKPEEAEKIIMSNRGLREARKRQQGKGCAVVALLFLGSAATAVGTLWAATEVIVRALS